MSPGLLLISASPAPAGVSRNWWDHAAILAATSGRPMGSNRWNFLVNRRMNKSQQMRWSQRGADLVLQVRCAVYNGTLGSGFGQRFEPVGRPDAAVAIAA